jgi:hypothetical protein
VNVIVEFQTLRREVDQLRHSANRSLAEKKDWSKDSKSDCGVPTCTGFAVCFSPLWVLTRPKLRLRSAKPSAPQGSRSRFRWRDARKQATQNIGGERRACE